MSKSAAVARKVATTTRTNGAATRSGDEDEVLRRLEAALRAAAAGDFSHRLPARRKGVVGELEAAYNQLVERNAQLTAELVRLGRVVGREGRMTERASLDGAHGGWSIALESVNGLVDDLVRPTTEVARVIVAVAEGDLTQKMALTIEGQPLKGEFARIGTTVNAMVDQLGSFADEVSRVVREMGTEGRLGSQAPSEDLAGTWKDLVADVNLLSDNLTAQVRNIAVVSTAIANGDLSQKITVETRGEILELKNAINATVDQLRAFAAEVIRVAKEVGTEGKLGAQADVRGVSGVWHGAHRRGERAGLEPHLAGAQHRADRHRDRGRRSVAEDHRRGARRDPRAHDTINAMVDQLRTFAGEVTRVARDVGTEGKLGAQANVRGRLGHVEGPDRHGQLAGRQPHRSGAQHRAGLHRDRQGRSVEEDHRRRQGRDPAAQGDHQRDGRPAADLRGGGHPRRQGGRHRGQARRSGRRARASRARGRTSPTT